MLRSMTGYGRAVRAWEDRQIVIELSAVNRRGAEVSVALPREWSALEPRVRELVLSRIARGRVQASIQCQTGPVAGSTSLIDAGAARRFHDELLALQGELGLAGSVSLETILSGPGVVRESASAEPIAPERAWPAVEAALSEGLGALATMREEEGRRLAGDFRARLGQLRAASDTIAEQHPAVADRHREALRDRIQRAGIEVPPDDERLAKEIALFADRSDISEEITRLRGHIEQFESLLARPEPVGRTLDFLAQELARECNTLGVKCNDLAISRIVVACKAEVEKLREQVQNIE